jgi:hypothetical protein
VARRPESDHLRTYARVTETVTNRGRQAASYSPASGPGPAPTALAMPRMCPRASKPPPHPQNSPRSIPPDDRFPDPGPLTDLGNAQTGPLARLRQGCTDGHAAPPQPRRPAHRPPGQHAGRSRAHQVTRPPPVDRLPRPASGEPPSQQTTGTPTAVPPPAPRLPENAPGAGRCDPGDQLHGPHRRPGALPVPVPLAATGPSSAARTHRSPSQPPARSSHHQPAAPPIRATRTQPPAQSTHPIPAHTRHAAATTARPAGSPHASNHRALKQAHRALAAISATPHDEIRYLADGHAAGRSSSPCDPPRRTTTSRGAAGGGVTSTTPPGLGARHRAPPARPGR